MDHTTFTASDGGVCDTECSKIKDKIVCSSSPFQDQNYCNLTHSSVKHEKNVSTSLSSVKTDSALQDGVLDLSEILDMETGRKCGNIRGQNSPCSIDKSKRNFEGMHSSPLLPASHSVKTKDANPAVSPKENLSLYRQIYEQDLKRLKSFESNAKKESKYIDGLSESDGGSSMKDNLKSPEKRTVTSDKLSSPQRKTDESERKEVQLDMLPDLRSDILRAYLGSQTPSTGPVFLQTPVPSVACPYQVRPTSSTPEELGTNSTVLILLPPKEVDCLKDGHSPASLDPVIQENLECQESLDLSPNELHLSIGSSSSSSMSLPHEPRQTFSESNPSATDSHSSEHYTMASSKCFGEDSSRLDHSMLLKFGKLSALIRGYLTRRLLKTEKVRRIKITIRDLMVTALKVHSEVSQEDEVNPNDVRLHGQILAELNATCEEFHRVFFEMTKSEQMAVISADRRRLLSSSGSIAVVDAVQVITPRPALLSAVTLKTLQRRFSMYSPKNGVEEAEKKSDGKQPTKKKMSSVGLGAGQRMTKNAKGRERTSARSTSRAFSISEDATSNSVSRNVKASNVPLTRRGHVPSKASKKKRRSASAGEINRKPWR
ncbi:centriolar coiled-coil protein of 110 kDa [Hetaerina americana]|uniref:centriolar coiled-coil protein of 110 kDa n=1 Tax=Hetaerina americana TaxID=62018 RepID=UPI003A7F3F04